MFRLIRRNEMESRVRADDRLDAQAHHQGAGAAQRRLLRLQVEGLPAHLGSIDTKLAAYERPVGKLRTAGLRLRRPFAHLTDPIDGDSSDRKAPPRELRPPATRISSSLGSALRLELTVIALLQLHRKPGARAHLADLEIPIAGDSQHTGWADLVAALPTDSNVGGIYHNARDKRARTVRKALERLEVVGLVDVPGKPGERNRFDGFVPLHEAGAEALGEREEYAIPEVSAAAFAMPPRLSQRLAPRARGLRDRGAAHGRLRCRLVVRGRTAGLPRCGEAAPLRHPP